VIKLPKPPTVKRYGLTLQGWVAILDGQGGVCRICEQVPQSGRLCIDHEHVKGWKKMAPERRRLYVRGLLCWRCNHYYVGRGITVQRAQNVLAYLEAYAQKLKASTKTAYIT
jgi:hypothetical protein